MLYTIYKTTNLINNKFYIGKHQTDNPNDSYMGSGKALLDAIKKYGKENFCKEVLFVFDSEDLMNQKEKELVTEDLVSDTNTYNLGVGGEGGPHFLGKTHSVDTKKKISDIKTGQKHSIEIKMKISENNFSRRAPIEQKEHASKAGSYEKSEEHRKKLSDASKKNHSGKSNLGKIRDKVKCPYCGKEGANNTMTQWHFDKCKFKSPITQHGERDAS